MSDEKIYTSDEILALDSTKLADVLSENTFIKYQLTEDEKGWIDFVRGKYNIADYIDDNEEDGVVEINIIDFSVAIDLDGGEGKAVCLSDETALQKIFFCGYTRIFF